MTSSTTGLQRHTERRGTAHFTLTRCDLVHHHRTPETQRDEVPVTSHSRAVTSSTTGLQRHTEKRGTGHYTLTRCDLIHHRTRETHRERRGTGHFTLTRCDLVHHRTPETERRGTAHFTLTRCDLVHHRTTETHRDEVPVTSHSPAVTTSTTGLQRHRELTIDCQHSICNITAHSSVITFKISTLLLLLLHQFNGLFSRTTWVG